MNPSVTSAPEESGIDLEELKSQLAITGTADDARLSRLALAALAFTEAYVNRALIKRTYLYKLQRFGCVTRGPLDDFWYEPAGGFDRVDPIITLPYPPLVQVNSVKYYDDAGVLQTINSNHYQVDVTSEPGRIAPVYGYTWPYPGQRLNPIEIEYVAGYGEQFGAIPNDLRHAIMMLVGHLNENREATSTASVESVPLGYDDLVARFKTGSF